MHYHIKTSEMFNNAFACEKSNIGRCNLDRNTFAENSDSSLDMPSFLIEILAASKYYTKISCNRLNR